jgi:hypothetical protein
LELTHARAVWLEREHGITLMALDEGLRNGYSAAHIMPLVAALTGWQDTDRAGRETQGMGVVVILQGCGSAILEYLYGSLPGNAEAGEATTQPPRKQKSIRSRGGTGQKPSGTPAG